ncbi:type I pullulanase [Candidatus Riflebacteria bacterium]
MDSQNNNQSNTPLDVFKDILKDAFNYCLSFFKRLPRPDKNEIIFHYYRHDNEYTDWELWIWHPQNQPDGINILPDGKTDFGIFFKISLEMVGSFEGLGFLFKKGDWLEKEGNDRFLRSQKGQSFFIISKDDKIHTSLPDLRTPISKVFLDSPTLIQAVFPISIKDWELNDNFFELRGPRGKKIKIEDYSLSPKDAEFSRTVNIKLKNPLSLKSKNYYSYNLTAKNFSSRNVELRGILYDQQFYSEKVLGCHLKHMQYSFRVFAPTADQVFLRLYHDAGGSKYHDHPMEEDDNGVWEILLPEDDCEGRYYRYRILGNDFPGRKSRLVLDPYSKSHTHHFGRSLILSHESLKGTPVADSPKFKKSDAIIYETHIRDFTIHEQSGVKNKGKYLGFTEIGSHIPQRATLKSGISHLKELGVNVIQLLPIQDFDNDEYSSDYNWGYMPWFYFCPEGWYSSNPRNASRIVELKKMVSTLHENGFKVVMDVVYNHTAETDPNISVSLNGCAPGYYYRRKANGDYFNGSGCGNEVKTEAPMMRKLILDSLKYWVSEFKIDGFRFDLMGLMDYETFILIEKELTAINPDILLYGEPWAAGEAGIEIMGKGFQRGYNTSVFNDDYRNAILGNAFDNSPGFIQNGSNVEEIKKGIKGGIDGFAASPLESFNYFSCHDNRTLRDKLLLNEPDIDFDSIKKIAKMAAALILTSQGVPFFLSGEELLRTKAGIDNSYNSPDEINQIDWGSKGRMLDLFHFYRDLISLRKAHPLLRLEKADDVNNALTFLEDMFPDFPGGTIAFMLENINNIDSVDRFLFYFNPQPFAIKFEIPKGNWQILLHNYKLKLKKRGQKKMTGNILKLGARQIFFLVEYPQTTTSFKKALS